MKIDGKTWAAKNFDSRLSGRMTGQSIVAYGRRKKMLRLELQKRFELIRGTEDLDPNQFRGLEAPKESQIGKGEESCTEHLG